MRTPSFTSLMLIAMAMSVFTACSSSPPVIPVEKTPAAALNPADAIRQIGDEISAAKKTQIHVLSPSTFARAENAYAKAKSISETTDNTAMAIEYADTARTYLYDAAENAKIARTVLGAAIESREKAQAAGADKMEEKYGEIETRFTALTQAIEKDNIRYAQKNAPEVAENFKKLELRAIKKAATGEVAAILKQAEEDNITQYAPKSFALANKLLNETRTFITDNPYAKDEIYEMARHNLFMTRRAIAIADHSKAIATMPPEEIAFYIEDTLGEISRKLGAPDMRDQKFYVQVENIKKMIESLLDSNQLLSEKLQLKETNMQAMQTNYEKQVTGLNQQIAFLEGKTEEKEAINEQLLEQKRRMQQKLEAERQFHLLFIKVQNFFEPDEADVYKKGDQLVIRLKGIRFPVGQAVIMPNSYMLLSKVQKAIKTFGEPSVTIEGHTDSTGTLDLNKTLSLARAESVRQYLIANLTLPAAKLSAAGYGSEKPLASNATPEGRAANRRIDIIITPETAPEAL